ncbi:hypothetical protein DJ68_10490, partial [Halorubrum sp. C3]
PALGAGEGGYVLAAADDGSVRLAATTDFSEGLGDGGFVWTTDPTLGTGDGGLVWARDAAAGAGDGGFVWVIDAADPAE